MVDMTVLSMKEVSIDNSPLYEKTTKVTTKVQQYPAGYPQLAALLNSDSDFPVYRRFGTLRSRVILHRQHELAKLEEQLMELDKEDSKSHPHRIQSVRKDEADTGSQRSILVDTIELKLKNYGIWTILQHGQNHAKNLRCPTLTRT
jgi:hypothetical protein